MAKGKQFLIIDQNNRVCFDSDIKDLTSLFEADNELEYCLCKIYGNDCNLKLKRQKYKIIAVA